MTGLDTETLREALRAGHHHGGAPDVALIMGRGRRLRRRRRVTAIAGTLCALALLAGAGTGIADLASSSPASVPAVSSARPATHGPQLPARRTATAGPATPVPVATATPSPTGSPAAPVSSRSAPAASPTAAGQPTPATTGGQPTGQPSSGQPAAASQPPTPFPSFPSTSR